MTPLGRTPPIVAYDIKAILQPAPGRSYLGFACSGCGERIAMLNAAGARVGPSPAPSRIEVRCPACGAAGLYSTADLATFRA